MVAAWWIREESPVAGTIDPYAVLEPYISDEVAIREVCQDIATDAGPTGVIVIPYVNGGIRPPDPEDGTGISPSHRNEVGVMV